MSPIRRIIRIKRTDTAQKMKFSIKDLVTFTEEILNGKLNGFYSNFYSVFLVHDTPWYAKIWFPERRKQAWPKNLHLSFSFLIFSDENNIGNIVCDVWGDLFSTNCVSYCTTEYEWTWFSKAAVRRCFAK